MAATDAATGLEGLRRAPLSLGVWLAAFVPPGCAWDEPLRSDPGAWSPEVGDETEEASSPSLPGCAEEPPESSTAPTLSHRSLTSHAPGLPCLAGCHEEGGSSSLVFAAAGTAYLGEESRSIAPAGREIHGIGGTILELDRCGNFYASADELSASAASTQPFVLDPTFRKMEKSMVLVKGPGDCNQSGCHDFSEKGTSGIFF